MHSSRMRTVRCSGHDGGVHLPGQTTPLAGHPPPGRPPGQRHLLGQTTPLWADPPAQCMLGYTPLPCPVYAGIHPPVDRQTPVKTLPFRNYCCGR